MNNKLAVLGLGLLALVGVGGPQLASAAPSAPAAIAGPARPMIIAPYRIYDSRDPQYNPTKAKIKPGFGLTVCSVQSAVAFVAHLTITEADGDGYATEYPANGLPAGTSTVNYWNDGHPHYSTDQIATDTQGCFRIMLTGAAAHVVVDVEGYYIQ